MVYDKTPEEVKRYADWHKAAYGWNPFEPAKCSRCKMDVPLIQIYRCYDCDAIFCKSCIRIHCLDSEKAKTMIASGKVKPEDCIKCHRGY